MKYFLIAVLVLLLAGCNSAFSDTATKEMHRQGYTDVEFGSMTFFGCAKGAYFNAEFTAKNSSGQYVRGVTCGYLLFGYSVRIQ